MTLTVLPSSDITDNPRRKLWRQIRVGPCECLSLVICRGLRPRTYASAATFDGSIVCTNDFSSVVSVNATLSGCACVRLARSRSPGHAGAGS